VSKLKKQVNEMKAQLDDPKVAEMPSGQTPKDLNELNGNLQKLWKDLQKHKEDTGKNFKGMNEALLQKVDRADLDDLEGRIYDKLNEIVKQLMAKFMDRNELKKKF